MDGDSDGDGKLWNRLCNIFEEDEKARGFEKTLTKTK